MTNFLLPYNLRNYTVTLIFSSISILSAVAFSGNTDGRITMKFQEWPESDELAGILSVMDAYQVTAKIYADSPHAK